MMDFSIAAEINSLSADIFATRR